MKLPFPLKSSKRNPFLFNFCLLLLIEFICSGVQADESDKFFDDSYVHEIRLTIDDANWHSTLNNSHANDSEDPYFPASFSCDGVTIEKIGVRMKGNSSFRVKSIKKSFKLDFDEFDEDNDELHFLGIKKLNLNNGFKDPTMIREKIFLDFASQYVPTIRCVHVRLYINDEYIGLYSAVEQVDKNFIEDRFGGNEDGNLYKGAASDDGGPQSDFGSDLAWEGSDEVNYHDSYQLKTNEEANDYSGLVEMINILNNTDPAAFPENLEPVMDVYNVLAGLALDSLFSNHDSYTGSAHNYYVYQSDLTGQFSHIFWDTNEVFGTFAMLADPADMRTLHPFWTPDREARPLMERLWENEDYEWMYLYFHARMLAEGFDVETMTARIEELANLIRTDLYADPNKLYSNSAFETNLYSSSNGAYGLQDFVQQRASYLQGILDGYEISLDEPVQLFINELMAENDLTMQDPDGEGYPDWFEIYNPNEFPVDMGGMFLTDSADSPRKWMIPQGVEIAAGGFMIFWADNDEDQGPTHTNFKLSSTGEELALYDTDLNGNALIDLVEFGELGPDKTYGRTVDGGESLGVLSQASPGTSNSADSFLGFEVVLIGEQEWVDTGDWIGWLEVGDNPWVWSSLWNDWIFLSESLSDSTGSWVYMTNPAPLDSPDTSESAYLGYFIQIIDDNQWIATGDWFGWLEVSQAPWVWSATTSSWIYVYKDGSNNSSIWFRVIR